MAEMTAVAARRQDHARGPWAVVRRARRGACAGRRIHHSEQGSVPGIQLAHAGRKAGRSVPWDGNIPLSAEDWGVLQAPSALPFTEGWQTPHEMNEEAIGRLVADFGAAARRAAQAGFKVIEAHCAHGYLLHEFLSPLSNRRTDRFGGSLENRARAPLMMIRAMRENFPQELPVFVRLSVVDWHEGGLDLEQSLVFAQWLKEAGVDLIDCSSGAVVPDEAVPLAPGYHSGFSQCDPQPRGHPDGCRRSHYRAAARRDAGEQRLGGSDLPGASDAEGCVLAAPRRRSSRREKCSRDTSPVSPGGCCHGSKVPLVVSPRCDEEQCDRTLRLADT